MTDIDEGAVIGPFDGSAPTVTHTLRFEDWELELTTAQLKELDERLSELDIEYTEQTDE